MKCRGKNLKCEILQIVWSVVLLGKTITKSLLPQMITNDLEVRNLKAFQRHMIFRETRDKWLL